MPTNENAAALAGDHGVRTIGSADRIRLDAAEQVGSTHAPYAREVSDLVARGRAPNTYLFAGADAWDRARKRRELHGEGTALVLPPHVDPLTLRWPALPAVLVVWPGSTDIERKFDLARALVRDGVRSAQITHEPEWLSVRAKAIA